jgi:hypothetical protein
VPNKLSVKELLNAKQPALTDNPMAVVPGDPVFFFCHIKNLLIEFKNTN